MYQTFPSKYTPDPGLPAEIVTQTGANLYAIEAQPPGPDDQGPFPMLYRCDVNWHDPEMPDQAWCESLAQRIAASYTVCRLIPIETLRAMVESGTRIEGRDPA